MNICVFGLSHKTAPIEVREKIMISKENILSFNKKILQKTSAKEALFLGTCNRSEIYCVCQNNNIIRSELQSFIKNEICSEYSHPTHSKYFYFMEDIEAIRHLFKVSSSLDSMILGENEILGQVKEAFKNACTKPHNTVGKIFYKLFHYSFRCAKEVKTTTGISSIPVSMGHIAVDLAIKNIKDTKKIKVAVIGAGQMGSSALSYLKKYDFSHIYLLNRNFQTASQISKKLSLKNLSVLDISNLRQAIKDSDVVICATSSKSYLIKKDELKIRDTKPLSIIDISIPRNVDPDVKNIPNVSLFDIDDLEKIKDTGYQKRNFEAQKAQNIINTHVIEFLKWLHLSEIDPIIDSIKNQLENIRKNEMNKIYTNHLKHIRSLEKEDLDIVTSSIVKKITSHLIPAVKKKALTHKSREDLQAFINNLSDLFQL